MDRGSDWIGSEQSRRGLWAGLLWRPSPAGFKVGYCRIAEPGTPRGQERHGGWLVLPDPNHGGPAGVERYQVFAGPNRLHRDFARLAGQKGTGKPAASRKIVGFADRHGFLLPASERHVVAKAAKRLDHGRWGEGEPVERWRAEANQLAALLAVWDLARKGDAGALRKHFQATGRSGEVEAFPAWDKGQLTTSRSRFVAWREVTYDGRAEPVASDLPEEIRRDRLPGLFGPHPDILLAASLYLRPKINGQLAATRAVVPTDTAAAPWPAIVPQSLLAAIYACFLIEMLGGHGGACLSCGEPLPSFEGIGRPQRYCGPACKQRAYRARKARRAAD